jgi:hypothetical protein
MLKSNAVAITIAMVKKMISKVDLVRSPTKLLFEEI